MGVGGNGVGVGSLLGATTALARAGRSQPGRSGTAVSLAVVGVRALPGLGRIHGGRRGDCCAGICGRRLRQVLSALWSHPRQQRPWPSPAPTPRRPISCISRVWRFEFAQPQIGNCPKESNVPRMATTSKITSQRSRLRCRCVGRSSPVGSDGVASVRDPSGVGVKERKYGPSPSSGPRVAGERTACDSPSSPGGSARRGSAWASSAAMRRTRSTVWRRRLASSRASRSFTRQVVRLFLPVYRHHTYPISPPGPETGRSTRRSRRRYAPIRSANH